MRWREARLLLVLSSLSLSYSSQFVELSQLTELHRPSSCVSCASDAYLSVWSQLLHHYFPPKNFSDVCWQPDASVGVVPCSSACFTLVELITRVEQGQPVSEERAVLRGCSERLLLFGFDEDVRDRFRGMAPNLRVCREVDRRLYHLFPLTKFSDIVLMCACTGSGCNSVPMGGTSSSQPTESNVPCLVLLLVSLLSFFSWCAT